MLISLAAVSLVACGSNLKPTPLAATPSTPPSGPPTRTYQTPPPTPVEQGTMSDTAPPGSERDFVINAGDRVYFDFNKFDVRNDARGILDAQAAWLARYGAVHVRIEGNCDELGTREYNFALGARRADAVKEYLIGRGIAAGRIETVSYGKEHPVDTGGGEAAAAHDRNAHTTLTQGAR
jgi:peptidoglycan-associated lipoprotein